MKKTTKDYHIIRVYVAPYHMPIYEEYKAYCELHNLSMSYQAMMLIDDFLRSQRRKKSHDKKVLISAARN